MKPSPKNSMNPSISESPRRMCMSTTSVENQANICSKNTNQQATQATHQHTIQATKDIQQHTIQATQDIHQCTIQSINSQQSIHDKYTIQPAKEQHSIQLTNDIQKENKRIQSNEKAPQLNPVKQDEDTEWLHLLVNSHLFKPTYGKPILRESLKRSNSGNEPPVLNVVQPGHRKEKNQSSKYSVDEHIEKAIERDEVKERLELAAAKRNAIKQARLKDQMDLAWLETVEMMKQVHKSHSSLNNNLLYQKLKMNAPSEPSSSKPLTNQHEILIW